MKFLQDSTAPATGAAFDPDTVARPANPEGCAPFLDFHEELDFWDIDRDERQLIYSFANGACAAEFAASGAAELFDALEPDAQLLFHLLDQLEERYAAQLAVESENEPDPLLAHMRAFRSTITGLLADRKAWLAGAGTVAVDRRAWCAFLFCAGVLARQRGGATARDLVAKLRRSRDNVEYYLFTHIASNQTGARHFHHELPILRYIDSCYPNTQEEPLAITAIFLQTFLVIGETEGNQDHSLARYFIEFHSAGLRLARTRPELLQRLIADLDGNNSPGEAAVDARFAREHLGPDPAEWTPAVVWRGCRSIIASQQPHLLFVNKSPTPTLHYYDYFQRMIDAAFWTGLIAGRPEAFEADEEG